jgi:hypothetical protein
MTRTRVALLVVAIAAASLVPATAGDARPRTTHFKDCIVQKVLLPITREQAQSYLPEGFSPVAGVLGQPETTNLEFVTFTCGDSDSPELDLVLAMLLVEAPARYGSQGMSEQFILDMVGAGPRLKELTKAVCIEDFVQKGEIATDIALEILEGDTGFGLGTTTVESPVLSGTFDSYVGGQLDPASSSVRSFYERGGKIRYFDSAHSLTFLGLGVGDAVLTSGYRDLTPVAEGAAIFQARDHQMFVTPPGC